VAGLLSIERCGTLEVMASHKPPGTTTQPSAPEKEQPPQAQSPSDAPRIVLPKNLAQTLQFLSDDDFETLRTAVDVELGRRRPQPAPAATISIRRDRERDSAPAIPSGRASLIKASYQAGMKPAAIARTLRLSLSVVNRVLGTKPKARQ
jgi:hypothetical protein